MTYASFLGKYLIRAESVKRSLFSRKLKTLNYDTEKETLSILFSTGNNQDYSRVPGNVYQQMEISHDRDGFYNKKIFGKYPIS